MTFRTFLVFILRIKRLPEQQAVLTCKRVVYIVTTDLQRVKKRTKSYTVWNHIRQIWKKSWWSEDAEWFGYVLRLDHIIVSAEAPTSENYTSFLGQGSGFLLSHKYSKVFS
jgi:hypothetical protein